MFQNPYKDLLPYELEDARYFFGRTTERRVIANNLRAAALTVFYGPSGVGKSSVLRAGITHDFRQDPEYLVIVFKDWLDPAFARLNEVLRRRLAALNIAVKSAAPQNGSDPLDDLESLLVTADRTLLLILDQFEEYFKYHTSEKGQATFAGVLPRLLNRRDLPVNVLISLREDSMSVLDGFKGSVPRMLENRLSIDHLTPEEAFEAILRPLEVWNAEFPGKAIEMNEELANEVIAQIIEAQGDEKHCVQAPYLQLVMTRWWEREFLSGSPQMRRETLVGLGGVSTIVNQHLATTMESLDEGSCNAAADLFDSMVTSTGRKLAQTVSELAGRTNLSRAQLEGLLERLSSARVLSLVPPPKGSAPGERCYEFAHDVMAKAALNWMRDCKDKQSERARQSEEEKARAVQAAELAAARQNEMEANQRAEERAKIAARFQRLCWGLTAAVVMAAFSWIYAWWQHHKAEDLSIETSARAAMLAADKNLTTDPELAVSLAHWAFSKISKSNKGAFLEAEDELRRLVQAIPEGVEMRPNAGSATAHANKVSALAFSPDGKHLVTGSWDKTARVWNVETGEPESPPLAQDSEILGVSFTGEGRVATVDFLGTLALWDPSTWKTVSVAFLIENPSAAAFSANGKYLAIATSGGNIDVWEVASHKRLTDLGPVKGDYGAVTVLLFSPDSNLLAGVYADGSMTTWDGKTGRRLPPLERDLAISEFTFSADSKEIATVSHEGTVSVWTAGTQKKLSTIETHGSRLSYIALSRNGDVLAASRQDGRVKMWDVASGEELPMLFWHKDYISQVLFSPDGSHLVTASTDGAVKVWNVSGKSASELVLTLPIPQVYGAAFADRGRLLVAGHQTKVDILDASSGRPRRVFDSPDLLMFTTSHDRPSIAVFTRRTLWIKDVTSDINLPLQKCTAAADSIAPRFLWADFSQDFNVLALADIDNHIIICNDRMQKAVPIKMRSSSNGAMRPDGAVLAVAFDDGHVSTWDTNSGNQLRSWPTGGSGITNLAYSYDGEWLATISHDNRVRLWDAATGRSVGEISQFRSVVTAVSFAESKGILAAGSLDGTASVWDLNSPESPKELYSFTHESSVSWVDISPDSEKLAVTTADGYVRVYHLKMDIDGLVKLAERRARGNLTLQDCKRYVPEDQCRPAP
jgi:WD40 repeat protein